MQWAPLEDFCKKPGRPVTGVEYAAFARRAHVRRTGCGDGALVRHLQSFGLRCVYAADIATGQDALTVDSYGAADAIITNPPYTRPLMHALIEHFARSPPTWLLIETDWASTKQAAAFMPTCTDIVSVGRLRWIEGTTMNGKQNFAWFRFDAGHSAGPIFHAHGSDRHLRA